jgi:hypothetical protein
MQNTSVEIVMEIEFMNGMLYQSNEFIVKTTYNKVE